MPRPKRKRKMQAAPIATAFGPVNEPNKPSSFEINLLLEEFESLRLSDYEGMSHFEAAELMHISRPTYTRIYNSARKKMAKALVENKLIYIRGGQVDFAEDWYRCHDCDDVFVGNQHYCDVGEREHINATLNSGLQAGKTITSVCVCQKCGKEYIKTRANPCRHLKCEHCGSSLLIRMNKNNLS